MLQITLEKFELSAYIWMISHTNMTKEAVNNGKNAASLTRKAKPAVLRPNQTCAVLLALILSGCQFGHENTNASREVNNNIADKTTLNKFTIVRENDSLKRDLFPFEFKNFNIDALKTHLPKNAVTDSIEHRFDGYTSKTYKFANGNSHISLLVKMFDKKGYFYLEDASFESNLIQFKNGVKIGMPQRNVCKLLKINPSKCDTIEIQEGDWAIYYNFIFRNNKLVKLNIYSD